MRAFAPYLIACGLALVVLGVLLATGALGWFGHLPGDIRIERAHLRLYAPITSMLLLSAVVSAVAWVVGKWLG